MMKRWTGKWPALAALLLAALLLTAPAWSAQVQGNARAADTSHRFGGKSATLGKAIEKTGFFNGFKNDRVSLIEEKSYRELSYLVAKDMVMTYEGKVLEQKTLLPHSIVKLIIVDAEVVEIVLLQESS